MYRAVVISDSLPQPSKVPAEFHRALAVPQPGLVKVCNPTTFQKHPRSVSRNIS